MRFYVYAIHTDETRNRLHDVFDNNADAEALEKHMQKQIRPGDNYFVTMLPAENVDEARVKADEMRPLPQLNS
ncbi:hypothetical protein HGP14_33065 [Rhizobium sp. P32RR-XVIII]|uniref:hypothetical protein n=1 Tax=Rhizobium sp. P32RR-XVIII TaxID=2726738 RepID=UPI0014576D85|nr:hypothetical protein [Rhizobium sp. P32RR-XVIII]NLS08036.1 hypothetical protein [Rhizobium sp. P32RR-XVIII]